MEQGFDYYKNIYKKQDLEPYVDCITKISSGEFAYSKQRDQLTKDFVFLLNSISQNLLANYIPQKDSKNINIRIEETNYNSSNVAGYFDVESVQVVMSAECLIECLLKGDTATPIGVVIHETSHLIQVLAFEQFFDEDKIKNSYTFGMKKWLDDPWYENVYNKLICDVVVPYINDVSGKNIKTGKSLYLPSTILYNNDQIEKEAYKMQAHYQRNIGSLFAEMATDDFAKRKILKNYFSTKNNLSGKVQKFNYDVKNKNYDFISGVADLQPEEFANLLLVIEEYSKKFNCKSFTAMKSERFGKFIREDSIKNLELLYCANNTKQTFEQFLDIKEANYLKNLPQEIVYQEGEFYQK